MEETTGPKVLEQLNFVFEHNMILQSFMLLQLQVVQRGKQFSAILNKKECYECLLSMKSS